MEMEQEIDSIFENITERPPPYDKAIQNTIDLLRYLQLVVSLLGFLLNTLIIFVILRSKQMKTRTNIVFANRCVYDILYLVSDVIFFTIYVLFGEGIYDYRAMVCLHLHTMGLFEVTLWGFTLMLLSNKLMNTKELSTKTMLITVNSTVLVYYIAQVIQCVHNCSFRNHIAGVVAIILGVLLVSTTITKDVNRCRRNSNIPISKDSNFRLNIARILTYNWGVCYFFVFLSSHHLFLRFFDVCMSLNAVYTFAYMVCAEEAYKKRILKVLNFDFEVDVEESVVENCVYAKTTRKDQNVVVDFKPLDVDENED